VVLVACFLAVLFAYVLSSRRLERTVITGPIVFLAAGVAAQGLVGASPTGERGHELFLAVAETSLVLLLFADASRTNLRLLRRIGNLPARLLTAGMLGSIVLGGLAATVVFGGLSLWQAGILAAILAPTDAGLGQIIVRSKTVPDTIREALAVEAGLNDGLAVPFLLFFMALSITGDGGSEARLVVLIRDQLGLGALIGLAIGGGGGALLSWSRRRRWTADELGPIAIVVLPLLCILAAEAAGASMFIAAFVAGLATRATFSHAPRHSMAFTEGWGQLLSFAIFFLFGLIVAREWRLLDARFFIYAALSLTLVRMLPVALSLVGTGLDRASTLFIAWFGPRGLASIVLGLVYLEQHAGIAGSETIRLATTATVLLSIVAHGLTAVPGTRWIEKSRKSEVGSRK